MAVTTATSPTVAAREANGAGVVITQAELRPAWCLAAAPVAIAIAVAAVLVALDDLLPVEVVRPAVATLWALCGGVLAVRRRHDRLAPLLLLGAGMGAVGSLAAALLRHRELTGTTAWLAQVAERLSLTMLAALALHLLVALPQGRLGTRGRRQVVVAGYVIAVAVGCALMAEPDRIVAWPVVVLWLAAVAVGLSAANTRYRTASALERRRMQWLGWALAVSTELILVMVALRLLTDWPDHLGAVSLAVTGLIPLSFVAGTQARLVARVDRLLTHTVSLAGLTALIVVVYVVVVLGLGRTPEGGERTLLLLSMLAAGIAALAYLPARRWLSERANRLVYGEREAPDTALRTFGQRLTRAIPMDELLLQMAESLRKSMTLSSAEVWAGENGRYELVASVPHREPPPLHIGEKELPVVARAGVSGGTWIDIWLGQLTEGKARANLRVAPIAHAGELLGLIVVRRADEGEPFNDDEDRVLVELARQVALALHNVQLDSALQASLDEVRRQAEELQASRARIVATADQARRQIERNLHDGAQQHLVALAVKIGLARQLLEADPETAAELLDELRKDAQQTLTELRELAHGIYPPLLMDRGLHEALRASANRAVLPTVVNAEGVNRYHPDIEAAVYFCCLEAVQNAGKYAGDKAEITITVAEVDGSLTFEVADDGAGFDFDAKVGGHGFVNMTDRLGAIGGSLEVHSRPGAGTRVKGTIPV
ncbi:MAG TPA: histidine kinase [Acidimicrobiales bacterium]